MPAMASRPRPRVKSATPSIHALELLDKGEARVAEREASGKWQVNQWLKKAVLLSFCLNDFMSRSTAALTVLVGVTRCRPSSTGWGEDAFADAGFRAVPGAVVRRSAYIAPNVVLMPSFVNLGAYVDESTMIDTWSTVGSCAQIGKRVPHFRRRRHRWRARAAAGRTRHHRGRLLHRRPLARWPRA